MGMWRACPVGLLLALAIPGVRERAPVISRSPYEWTRPSGGTGC
jgi:hypothetical protein